MESLAAVRLTTDRRAVYDSSSHANLINTIKYSHLYDGLWNAVVSEPHQFTQVTQVQDAAKTLAYAKTIYDSWLTDAWQSVNYGVIHAGGFGTFSWSNIECLGCRDFENEFEWMTSHRAIIDSYAEHGTQPTVGIFNHFTRMREHAKKETCFDWSPSHPNDSNVLRNLHRFMDAVSLYAYWTVMQAYELRGQWLMTKRLQISLHDDESVQDMGTLIALPKACLENVFAHLKAQHDNWSMYFLVNPAMASSSRLSQCHVPFFLFCMSLTDELCQLEKASPQVWKTCQDLVH